MGCVLGVLLAAVLLILIPWAHVGEALGVVCWIVLLLVVAGVVARKL